MNAVDGNDDNNSFDNIYDAGGIDYNNCSNNNGDDVIKMATTARTLEKGGISGGNVGGNDNSVGNS